MDHSMTATDELRRLLDERGIKWHDYGYENHVWWGDWHAENRLSANGLYVKVEAVITPEQAIDATLGRGMCYPAEEYLDSYSDLTVTVCSGCGVPVDDLAEMNYCPNCGRKVVD